MYEPTFNDEIRRTPIDLPRAALRFARGIAYPKLDVGDYINRLDQMAETARRWLAPVHTHIEQAETLADFLFTHLEFQGNHSEYYDPRNSFLNEVLERRLGLPISLSVIYLALADRLAIPARGIGLPGHFIIGIHSEGNQIYLDPFHGGARLSEMDCYQLVQQTTGYSDAFQAEWLRPVNAEAILTRMLTNLRLLYLQNKDWSHAQAVVEHLRQLQPQMPELLRDLGVIHHREGSLKRAVDYYEQYLLQAPQAADSAHVRSYLQTAVRQLAQLN